MRLTTDYAEFVLPPTAEPGFGQTRYRGMKKNLNHLHILFAPRELADALPCRCPDRVTASGSLPGNGQDTPKDPERGRGHHENRPESPRPGPRTHRTPTDQRFLSMNPPVTSLAWVSMG